MKNNPDLLQVAKVLNQPQFIPSDIKIVLKIMAIKQGLYAQVFIICKNYLNDKKEK